MFSGYDDRDGPQGGLLDDEAEGSFSKDQAPTSSVVKCDQWDLHVKVTNKSFLAPRKPVLVQLDRYGYYSGWKKWYGDVQATCACGANASAVVPFHGRGTEYYKVRAVVDNEAWLGWTSQTKEVTLNAKDDKDLEIEVYPPRMVLISMGDFGGQTPWLQQDLDCAATYGLTATVTPKQIQAIIGDPALAKGSIAPGPVLSNAAALKTLLDFQTQPYFSVIDLNLSHQMSFFLACLAFQQYGRHPNKLIINIDNHRDYNGADRVYYSGWGAGFFRDADTLKSFLGADRIVYTILGETFIETQAPRTLGTVLQLYYSDSTVTGATVDWTRPMATFNVCTEKHPYVAAQPRKDQWDLQYMKLSLVPDCYYSQDDVDELVKKGILAVALSAPPKCYFQLLPGPHALDGLRDNNVALVKRLNAIDGERIDLDTCSAADLLRAEHVGDLSRTDVYFTVDRDSTQGNFSYWGDGYLTPDQMRNTVVRCLKYLKAQGANLVGFDLSGLPDSDGKSMAYGLPRTGMDPRDQIAAIIQQARDDIRHCREAVRDYGTP